MKNKVLNKFGKLLIEEVRDIAISEYYNIIKNNFVGEENTFLQSIIKKHKLKNDGLEKIVTEMIDRTIFKFLFLFEMNEEFSIVYDTGNSVKNLARISDGLAGEIFTDEGWIKKYSQYKQIDDWMNNLKKEEKSLKKRKRNEYS